MSEKPEALRLADELEQKWRVDKPVLAAAELRRLHAENERLKAERDEAVRAEREACAKICDRWAADVCYECGERHSQRCAAAIRARGQEDER